jgi:hypothetical protein
MIVGIVSAIFTFLGVIIGVLAWQYPRQFRDFRQWLAVHSSNTNDRPINLGNRDSDASLHAAAIDISPDSPAPIAMASALPTSAAGAATTGVLITEQAPAEAGVVRTATSRSQDDVIGVPDQL